MLLPVLSLQICTLPLMIMVVVGFVGSVLWSCRTKFYKYLTLSTACSFIVPVVEQPFKEARRHNLIQVMAHPVLRSSVHTLFCLPPISCTPPLLKQHFWWPTMAASTHVFVSACIVCAREKSSSSTRWSPCSKSLLGTHYTFHICKLEMFGSF